jgi:hypothetical protein
MAKGHSEQRARWGERSKFQVLRRRRRRRRDGESRRGVQGPVPDLQRGQSMNILSRDQQIAVISALTEGCAIRATERLTGIHRDTIMRLGVRVGDGCATLHDAMMRGLHVGRIELDEAWSFVAKKQRHLKQTDPADFGDQYVFLALAGAGKAIISWRVGKRNGENTRAFLADLRGRVLGAPEISSDAFQAYPDAVEQAFGIDCSFGTIERSITL